MVTKKQVRQKTIYRYSTAFKQKVVSEIEKGDLTISQARQKYDIRGAATVTRWLQKMGKNHLLCKKVRIEMPDEVTKLKQQAARIRELEQALAQTQVNYLLTDAYFSLACQELGTDQDSFKKKMGKRPELTTK